jgi:hypothetical protein
MAGGPNPLAYSQSTHQAQICTTAGASILFLQEKIQAELSKLIEQTQRSLVGVVAGAGSAAASSASTSASTLCLEWLEKASVSVEDLELLGLRDFFSETDAAVIRLEKLPSIYRMGGTVGHNVLTRGSLAGLRKLRALEEKFSPGEPLSLAFKDFAIGVFLENAEWDQIIFNGKIIQISLDLAFACVSYALNDEANIPLEALAGKTPWQILYEEIHRENTPLLTCSTGRRNHLISILGGQLQYPGILLFARDAEFIERCTDEFLAKIWKELRLSQEYLSGDVSAESPRGSWFEYILTRMPEAIFFDELRKFIREKIQRVGMLEETIEADLSTGALERAATAGSFTQELNKYLPEDPLIDASHSDFAETDDADHADHADQEMNQLIRRAFIESRPMPTTPRVAEALRRIQYLREKYPNSPPTHWVMDSFKALPKGPAGVEYLCELGTLSLEYSEHLSHFRVLRPAIFLQGEQKAVRERMLEKYVPLGSPAFSGGNIEISPEDRPVLMAIIHDQTSGRHAFITNFFSCWFAIEDIKEKVRLLLEWLSQDSPVTDAFIEAYQLQHRRGLELYLSVEVINLILLHAIRTPVAKRTEIFNTALSQILDFIHRGFDGRINELQLQASSYPPEATNLAVTEDSQTPLGLGLHVMMANLLICAGKESASLAEISFATESENPFATNLSGIVGVLLRVLLRQNNEHAIHHKTLQALNQVLNHSDVCEKCHEIPEIFPNFLKVLKSLYLDAAGKKEILGLLRKLLSHNKNTWKKILEVPDFLETVVQLSTDASSGRPLQTDAIFSLYALAVKGDTIVLDKLLEGPLFLENVLGMWSSNAETSGIVNYGAELINRFAIHPEYHERILRIPGLLKKFGDMFETYPKAQLRIFHSILKKLIFNPLDETSALKKYILQVFDQLRDHLNEFAGFSAEHQAIAVMSRAFFKSFFVKLDALSKRASAFWIFLTLLECLESKGDIVTSAVATILLECVNDLSLTLPERERVGAVFVQVSGRFPESIKTSLGQRSGVFDQFLIPLFSPAEGQLSRVMLLKLLAALVNYSIINEMKFCEIPGVFEKLGGLLTPESPLDLKMAVVHLLHSLTTGFWDSKLKALPVFLWPTVLEEIRACKPGEEEYQANLCVILESRVRHHPNTAEFISTFPGLFKLLFDRFADAPKGFDSTRKAFYLFAAFASQNNDLAAFEYLLRAALLFQPVSCAKPVRTETTGLNSHVIVLLKTHRYMPRYVARDPDIVIKILLNSLQNGFMGEQDAALETLDHVMNSNPSPQKILNIPGLFQSILNTYVFDRPTHLETRKHFVNVLHRLSLFSLSDFPQMIGDVPAVIDVLIDELFQPLPCVRGEAVGARSVYESYRQQRIQLGKVVANVIDDFSSRDILKERVEGIFFLMLQKLEHPDVEKNLEVRRLMLVILNYLARPFENRRGLLCTDRICGRLLSLFSHVHSTGPQSCYVASILAYLVADKFSVDERITLENLKVPGLFTALFNALSHDEMTHEIELVGRIASVLSHCLKFSEERLFSEKFEKIVTEVRSLEPNQIKKVVAQMREILKNPDIVVSDSVKIREFLSYLNSRATPRVHKKSARTASVMGLRAGAGSAGPAPGR